MTTPAPKQFEAVFSDAATPDGQTPTGRGNTPAEAATAAARAAGISPEMIRIVGRDAASGEWSVAVGDDEPGIVGTITEVEAE